MALTVSAVRRSIHGNSREVIATVTFDSSYATGGEDLIPSTLGLTTISHVSSETAAAAAGTTAVHTKYDYTNKKLQAFWAAASATFAAEVTSTTNLSTYICRVRVIGN